MPRAPDAAPTLESLAGYLADRDVRAIVRGQLDGDTYWVLFGPGDANDYRVDSYVLVEAGWTPGGDCISAGDEESDGWDMLGALFVRAFTAAA